RRLRSEYADQAMAARASSATAADLSPRASRADGRAVRLEVTSGDGAGWAAWKRAAVTGSSAARSREARSGSEVARYMVESLKGRSAIAMAPMGMDPGISWMNADHASSQ